MAFISQAVNQRRIIVAGFFALFFLLGASVCKDYGVSWDEPTQMRYGQTALRYVLGHDQDLLTSHERYYGPAFELFLTISQKICKPKDARSLYFLRHFLSFVTFFGGVMCFYLLCRRRFRSWEIALVGVLLLIVSPRIFGHSFYNSKDLPFLSLFIISIYTMVRYVDNKKIGWAIAHALACAVLIDTRLMGVLVPAFTVSLVLKDLWLDRRTQKTIQVLASLAICVAALVVLVWAFWPTLWSQPLQHFIQAWQQMSRYPWNGVVLYGGRLIQGTELPWHYTPIWILISTPPVYLFLFAMGLVALARQALTEPARFLASRQVDIVALAWFGIPLLAIGVLHSVLYNAWRHSYFVYPAFLLIALAGVEMLWNDGSRIRRPLFRNLTLAAVVVVLGLGVGTTALFMVRSHPFEDVYFNSLCGGIQRARFRYDLDYWGLSYRKGLEYIVKHDPNPKIALYVETDPGQKNSDLLDPGDRERLEYAYRPEEAAYFLGAYHSRNEEYPYSDPVFTVDVENVPILSVYRLAGTPSAAEPASDPTDGAD